MPSSAQSRLTLRRVLLVGDRKERVGNLQALLEGDGLIVTRVRHGVEALAHARASPPDVVVADLLLSLMEGHALLRQWKDDPQLGRLPFVVYTAAPVGPEDEPYVLSLGADAFLPGLAGPATLLARLREVPSGLQVDAPLQSRRPEAGLHKAYDEIRLHQLEERLRILEQANQALRTEIAARRQRDQQTIRNQRLESIGTLAGGIAHDLNNQLTPVLMGVGLLKLGPVDEGTVRVLDTMERSARRGAELLRQVLSFARGVAGERVVVNPALVMREIEAVVRHSFPREITLEVRIAKELGTVLGDPSQLHQVLLHLCLNARDAMPGGGLLSLGVSNAELTADAVALPQGAAPGRHVVLEVTDSGCGISGENLNRIFDPFFTTKEAGKGAGLGLSTSLGIARSHGGFLTVQSELGRGSTFRLHLPARRDVPAQVTPAVEVRELPRGHGEQVLVVDDDTNVLGITRNTLEAFGYRVLTAVDGVQALALYSANRQDVALVLTDLMMPVMNGMALAVALRRINPDVLVIGTSGHEPYVSATRSPIAGLDHFLAKPSSAEALLLLFEQVLAPVRKARAQG
ncbi:MAG: hypothetical protein QG602_1058 [Verrucomicrobiota bacterium]|nr:hypothetical protein [Verrucomicrobiota bacterium]